MGNLMVKISTEVIFMKGNSNLKKMKNKTW